MEGKNNEKRKKAVILIIIILIVLLGVLFVPYKKATLRDGGTEEYRALAATYVQWHKITPDPATETTEIYEGFSWYLYPDSQKSLDELWEIKH